MLKYLQYQDVARMSSPLSLSLSQIDISSLNLIHKERYLEDARMDDILKQKGAYLN